MGGTLERFGGHNPIEPAALGVPVLLGPSIANIRDGALALAQAGGSRAVANPAQLADAIAAWAAHAGARQAAGEAGRAAAQGLRGASVRALQWLEQRGFWT